MDAKLPIPLRADQACQTFAAFALNQRMKRRMKQRAVPAQTADGSCMSQQRIFDFCPGTHRNNPNCADFELILSGVLSNPALQEGFVGLPRDTCIRVCNLSASGPLLDRSPDDSPRSVPAREPGILQGLQPAARISSRTMRRSVSSSFGALPSTYFRRASLIGVR
jgi:hypothetical protein